MVASRLALDLGSVFQGCISVGCEMAPTKVEIALLCERIAGHGLEQ